MSYTNSQFLGTKMKQPQMKHRQNDIVIDCISITISSFGKNNLYTFYGTKYSGTECILKNFKYALNARRIKKYDRASKNRINRCAKLCNIKLLNIWIRRIMVQIFVSTSEFSKINFDKCINTNSVNNSVKWYVKMYKTRNKKNKK